jgi:hypothetical protein
MKPYHGPWVIGKRGDKWGTEMNMDPDESKKIGQLV